MCGVFIAQRMSSDLSNVEQVYNFPAMPPSSGFNRVFIVKNGIYIRAGLGFLEGTGENLHTVQFFAMSVSTPGEVPLAGIIQKEVTMSSMLSISDVDVSLLSDSVKGQVLS